MTHSHMTRWIEAADAREVLLEGAMIRQSQESAPRQHIHLGLTIKTVGSWWHHSVTEHLLLWGQGRASTSRH
jgi:hypothetical protein